MSRRMLELEMVAAITEQVFSDPKLSRLLRAKEGTKAAKQADQIREHWHGHSGFYAEVIVVAQQAVKAELRLVRKHKLEGPSCLYEISEALGQALALQIIEQGYLTAEEVSREVRLAMASVIEPEQSR